SQIDLVATVLVQCGLSHKEYRFSKNILNPRSPHFAIFTYPDCLGMVAPEDTFLQDNVSGRVLIDRGSQKGQNKKPAQAFLQTLFDDIAAR
ncbi:MAG: LTA synthase family protein, partial [Bacteroidaceae bacterium]